MLRAWSVSSVWLGAVLGLACLGPGLTGSALAAGPLQPVAVPAQPITVQYHLLTEFTGAARSGGRIVVALTNRSPHPLSKVTVRLADPAVGKLTGPVQESIELAVGETRKLEGAFVLDADVVSAARPLEWIVLSTEPAGFAQQTRVRGELMPSASMDADVRSATTDATR